MANPYFIANTVDKLHMAVGLAIGMAECIVDPIATILIGKIFDGVQDVFSGKLDPSLFLNGVQKYVYGLVGVTCYSALMNSLGYFTWTGLGYSLGHKARMRMYTVFMKKDSTWLDCKSGLCGTAASLFKDIQDLEMATGVTSYEVLAMGCGAIAQIIVAFYYSWAVTLLCLAGVPILVLVGFVFSNPISNRILATKRMLDEISAKISWILTSLHTVKIFQREQSEWKEVDGKLVEQRSLSIKYWFLSQLQQGLCRAIVLLIFVQGFYFGSYMVQKHGLRAGSVVTVFWSCLNASSQLQLLMTHLVEWSKGSASAERLQKALAFDEEQELYNSIGLMPDMDEKMREKLERFGWATSFRKSFSAATMSGPAQRNIHVDTKPARLSSLSSDSMSLATSIAKITQGLHGHSVREVNVTSPIKPFGDGIDNPFKAVDDESIAEKGHITFSDVIFSFPTRQEYVLTGLNLEVEAGSTVFILGHSGSGKSTLAALLTGQYPWQAGSITIDSHDLHLLSRRWIEDNVYVCEQLPKLFDISIRENIKIGSRDPYSVTDEQIKQAVNDSCAEFVWELPEELETNGMHHLSGGQLQRISLARARVRNAPIMLFDEATSALDPELQKEVFQHILNYRAGKTTLIITHDLSVIPEGYPIYMIEEGQSTPYTTREALINSLKERPAVVHKCFIGDATAAEIVATVEAETADGELIQHFADTNRSSAASTKYGTLMMYRLIPNKLQFFIGMLICVVHAAINPVFSFLFSKLVMGILDPFATNTTLWAMLVLAFAFIDGIVSFLKLVLNVCADNWLRVVRSQLFGVILHAENFSMSVEDASYYLKLLINDSEKCSLIITLYWPGLCSMVVLGLVGFIWALVNGWKLTLVGSSILPAFVGVNQLYKYMSTKWTKYREVLRARVICLMLDLTSEAGFRTVKVQHLEKYFEELYMGTEDDLNSISSKMILQVGFGYGVLKCFPYALESLLLWYGMHLIGTGSYAPQQTMTVFSLLMFTIITIDQLTSSIGSIGTGFESVSRLISALREFNKLKVLQQQQQPVLTSKVDGMDPKWQEISFHYIGITHEDGTQVLGTFCETFRRGELVAVMGPSGAGKSSVARILLRLETPTNGEIVIDQKWDLMRMSINDIRSNITLVNQAPLDFFDGTIEDNLLYGLKYKEDARATRMINVCKACGVHEFVSNLEEGYSTRIKTGLLSGGQLQRLGIARAVIREPKVLILDECTSALDYESKESIKQMILNLKQTNDMIIIVITHQMDVAVIADRIVQL